VSRAPRHWLLAINAAVRDSRLAGNAALRDSRLAVDAGLRDSRRAVDAAMRDSRLAINATLRYSLLAVNAGLRDSRRAVDAALRYSLLLVNAAVRDSVLAVNAGLRDSRLAVNAALRHWLFAVNAALGAFLVGAFLAPVLGWLGATRAADALYAAYHLTCHQWAFRSFFLFGSPPLAAFDQDQLAALGLDPFGFTGNAALGWKMAICERDVAIYAGLLCMGLLYARGMFARGLSLTTYCILILPMAVDGFTQLFGWRESTWELRMSTGVLFGVASAWLVLPRLEPQRYAPAQDTSPSCPPASQLPAPRV
jgi:uncharacterized membrane protein